MKETNPYVTVTRSGNQFTYKHSIDCNDSNVTKQVSMNQVFKTAQNLIEIHERTMAGLAFMRDAFETLAGTCNDMTEYQLQGAAAICWSLNSSINHSIEDHRPELGVIEKMAAGEVA